jgi:hypothetical protein
MNFHNKKKSIFFSKIKKICLTGARDNLGSASKALYNCAGFDDAYHNCSEKVPKDNFGKHFILVNPGILAVLIRAHCSIITVM